MRVAEKRGEEREMIIFHLIWMFLKLCKGRRIINHSFYLDVLKIRMEKIKYI